MSKITTAVITERLGGASETWTFFVSFQKGCVTWSRLRCYVQSSAEVGEIERQEQPVYP